MCDQKSTLKKKGHDIHSTLANILEALIIGL